MPDAFLWSMTDGPISRTIILWDKTVIDIISNPGGNSVRVTAHESHAHARDEALERTEGEETFGLTLDTMIGARDVVGMGTNVAQAHRLSQDLLDDHRVPERLPPSTQELTPHRHALGVNLDPAQTVLDTFLELDATLGHVRAAAA